MRKTVRRGGVQQQVGRGGNKPPLTLLVLCNARSLRNKDMVNGRNPWSYGGNFTDRTEVSGESRGDKLCMYVNDKWCRQYRVQEMVCNKDIELLSAWGHSTCHGSLKIFCYVQFTVPPGVNASRSAFQVSDCIQEQLQRTPNAPIFIMGDLNVISGKT